MKLLAYPRTKPSGVEWLGDVPEHWGVSCLKHSVKELYSGGTPESGNPEYWAYDEEESTPWVSIGDMTRAAVVSTTDKRITSAGLASKRLRVLPAGTLLYSMYASLGKVAVLGIPATVNQAILGIVPDSKKSEQSFLRYWLIQMENHLELFSSSNTQDNLNAGKVRALPLVVPPPAEQQAIAAFLDRETGRVDRLVLKKRELIERLKEKRTALISRTVTRGLPPDTARAAGLPEITAFKDSGIPWLGKVPKHWSVLPFRRVTTRVDVGIAEAATHAYADEGVPLVRSTNIKFEAVDTSDLLFIEEEFAARLQSKALRADDIVTTRTGANLGVSAIIPKSLHMAQCFTLLISTLTPDCDPRFYSAFINADPGRTYFAMASLGAGQHNISVPILKEMPTVRPPLPEQGAIAAYLDLETAKLDALVGKVEEAVERLQEYRTALITAAVTGKIDVRGSVDVRPGIKVTSASP